jgi:hypothetical protein
MCSLFMRLPLASRKALSMPPGTASALDLYVLLFRQAQEDPTRHKAIP